MTHIEYIEKRKELYKEFVDANNPHKIGDIESDHAVKIKIETIGYFPRSLGGPPCAIYKGVELKKNGTPKKNNVISRVYQSNLKK